MSGSSTNLIKMSYSLLLVIIMGRVRIRGIDVVPMFLILGGVMSVINSWSGYVVNK